MRSHHSKRARRSERILPFTKRVGRRRSIDVAQLVDPAVALEVRARRERTQLERLREQLDQVRFERALIEQTRAAHAELQQTVLTQQQERRELADTAFGQRIDRIELSEAAREAALRGTAPPPAETGYGPTAAALTPGG